MAYTRTVTLELGLGCYLVQVQKEPHAVRVWREGGTGLIEGHGSRLQRVKVADVFRELISQAEFHEGITDAQGCVIDKRQKADGEA